ncbi:MAG TPA: secondary thiamine-phosphate synthase enzyme YjbQ [Actinomycetota bacterium]
MKSSTDTIQVQAEGRLAFVDLTDDLRRAIKDSGVTSGCAVVFCAHTTATLCINEWEEGALGDVRSRLESLIPSATYYAHDDLERRTQNLQEGHERANGRAHVTQMILGGSSHAIPVLGGEPALGQWQRLLLVELDDPKERSVVVHVFGE